MLGSSVLEVAIGLVFVFLLVSLICSQISNQLSEWLKWRALELEKGIRNLILEGDPAQVKKLYANPLIQSFSVPQLRMHRATQSLPWTPERPVDLPSFIPPRTFYLALFDTFVPGSNGKTTVTDLINAIQTMPDSNLKKSLLALVIAKNDDLENVRKNVEDWFNGAMSRVTEVYKSNMWRVSLVIGLLVAVILNVDAIAITSNLWRDPALRAVVASAAAQYEQSSDPGTQVKALNELNKLELPMGWHVAPSSNLPYWQLTPKDWVSTSGNATPPWAFLLKLVGWFVTGLGGAQGAPFWFDLLKKLTQRG